MMNARSIEASLLATRLAAVRTPGWQRVLAALGAALLAILLLYGETALSMVTLWARNETFTHGFLVLPITLWLVWRMRHRLARLTPEASPLAMLGFAAAGFVWLLGELATVQVLSQFALVTMLVLAVSSVLGFRVARLIAFPLAFLFFAVPFGEFAMPQLMEWTASVTVLGLRLSGIPVYREGLQFVIPSGRWSVVEACSGVRYLIASLALGTLFAYLNYHSLKRRLLFVAMAFVVPIIANWMRAYIIVMMGHYSGNTLATGVDHLIYGWLFFGLVIISMFWIGSFWRQEPLAQGISFNAPDDGTTSSPWLLSLTVCVLAMAWPLAEWQIGRKPLPELSQLAPLGLIPGWTVSAKNVADWKPGFDNPSASLHASFAGKGKLAAAETGTEPRVGLYVGYYRNQDEQRKLVSSSNVLVRSNDPQWAKGGSVTQQVSLNQQTVLLRSTVLHGGDTKRLLVWQGYWINGHLTSSDFKAKAYTALSRLMGQGDDSAVIIVYALKESTGNVTGNATAEVALTSFIQSAAPEILRALSVTGEKR